MAIDLQKLSPKELLSLISSANDRLDAARVAEIENIKNKIDALLSGGGFQIEEIYPRLGEKAASKMGKGRPVAAKYRDPSNPSVTWSGRGRRPAWFANALQRRGTTEADLLIGTDPVKPSAAKPSKTVKVARRKAAKRATRKRAAK